jgi:peroxiredoxin
MLDVTRQRGVATIACLAALAFGMSARADPRAADVGQAAPAFIAPKIDGGRVDLDSWRGHVVLLNFWATWCAPCRKELPMFESVYQAERGRGLEVVAISLDDPAALEDVHALASGLSFSIALAHDAIRNDFKTPDALPLTYVIDARGIIRARFAPTRAGLTKDAVIAAVQPLLATPAGVPAAH